LNWKAKKDWSLRIEIRAEEGLLATKVSVVAAVLSSAYGS
jgi:hypothetical protein